LPEVVGEEPAEPLLRHLNAEMDEDTALRLANREVMSQVPTMITRSA
jgi:hypothetical protein